MTTGGQQDRESSPVRESGVCNQLTVPIEKRGKTRDQSKAWDCKIGETDKRVMMICIFLSIMWVVLEPKSSASTFERGEDVHPRSAQSAEGTRKVEVLGGFMRGCLAS